MHILHALTHSILGGGQAVPFLLIKNFLKFYPDVRHTVMMPPGGVYRQRFATLPVHQWEFPFDVIGSAPFFSIRSMIRTINPTIIHTHGRGAGLYIRSISRKQLPVPRVHTHHGFHIPGQPVKRHLFVAMERWLDRNTDATIGVSESEKEAIDFSIHPKRSVITIPNIVDVIDVQNQANNESERRLSFDRFTVLMIGRDDPVKDYPLAFRTADYVLSRTDGIRFCFVGIEPRHPGILALQAKYPESIIAAGSMPNPLPLLKQASLLLITSKREGSPLSILEAMALGKPIVGTNVRGISDLVTDGATGMLAAQNAAMLGEKIALLHRDRSRYDTLAENAARFARECCQVRPWAERYYQLYTSLQR